MSTKDESIFEAEFDSTITKREQIERFYDRWVRTPFLILWDDWRGKVGLTLLLIYIAMGTVGVWITPHPNTHTGERLLLPFQSWQFPLGTDRFGQGILLQIIWATRPMLQMILAGAVATIIVATIVGVLSGFKGGVIDKVLMTVTDIVITLPGFALIIILAVILSPESPYIIGLILAVNAWAGTAREVRSEVLSLRNTEYVEVSEVMALPLHSILLKDILPNIMPYILINFAKAARHIIFGSVGLYFLGVLPMTVSNWGVMMQNAYQTSGALYTLNTAHWLIMPMLAIVLISMAFVLLAQSLDAVFNPRIRARHAETVSAEKDQL